MARPKVLFIDNFDSLARTFLAARTPRAAKNLHQKRPREEDR